MSKLSIVAFVVLLICGLFLMNKSYAYDTAKLQMKISGVKNNQYFLCVSNTNSCISIASANKGKVFPMEIGNVNYIFTANPYNQKMYPQQLHSSCKVVLKKDQTLTVKGHLVVKQIQNAGVANVQINHIHCVLT